MPTGNSDAPPNTTDYVVLPIKPLNPPAGVIRFYADPTGKLTAIDSTGTLALAGGLAPSTPIPPAQASGPQFNVVNYSGGLTINDAKKTFTATTTNGSGTITDATNTPWTAADVGKKIFCTGLNGNVALSVNIATISAFNSTSSISVSPATGNGNAQASSQCVWFSNKATAAFLAAGTAAKSAAVAFANSIKNFIEISSGGEIYCPDGGYVVDGPFYNQNYANANVLGVSFIGAGPSHCRIYMSPDVAIANNALIFNSVQAYGTTISGFSYDCSALALFLTPQGMARISNAGGLRLTDVEIYQCGTSSDSTGLIWINNSSHVTVDGLRVNNTGSSPTAEPALVIQSTTSVRVRNVFMTNPGGAGGLSFVSSCGQAFATGPRTVSGEGCFVESSVFDEGGNPGCCSLSSGSSVNFVGVTGIAGVTTVLSVDGTSSAYLSDSNFAPFGGTCGGGNRQAITIASGGYVYATGTSIQSCGTDNTGLASAVSGPAGATFVSAGGNDIRNCPGGPPCPLVTAATFIRGFGGGIVPKSSETHTPNTCYAVTGNLLATAQNLCQFLNDQNYQLLNITAQSGGTTPANSSCATPPVITISDGTRSATMTMTSGKTSWSSAVDAVTNINQVFAAGATLTISIGANTCATPPVNVAVSYIVQSVLNP